MLELLVGCEFLTAWEAEATLAPHWLEVDAPPLSPVAEGLQLAEAAAASPLATRARATTHDREAFLRCTPQEAL